MLSPLHRCQRLQYRIRFPAFAYSSSTLPVHCPRIISYDSRDGPFLTAQYSRCQFRGSLLCVGICESLVSVRGSTQLTKSIQFRGVVRLQLLAQPCGTTVSFFHLPGLCRKMRVFSKRQGKYTVDKKHPIPGRSETAIASPALRYDSFVLSPAGFVSEFDLPELPMTVTPALDRKSVV